MRQHFPLNPSTGVEDSTLLPWSDGNPATGTDGSFFGHALSTDIESEIINAVQMSGLTLNGADLTQLFQAMVRANIISTAITKTVGGTGADFPDLPTAFAWASLYRISYSGSLTFQCAAGLVTTTTTQLFFSHPNGDRITVKGAALTGSFPTYASLTKTGNNAPARLSDSTANLATCRAVIPTELRFASGANITFGSGINFQNILFSSDGVGSYLDLVDVAGSGSVTNCVFANANYCGLRVTAGIVALSNVIAFGCGQAGICNSNSGSIQQNGAVTSISNGSGSYSGFGLWITGSAYNLSTGALNLNYNKGSGVLDGGAGVSTLWNTTGGQLTCDHNGDNGAAAVNGAFLVADGSILTNNVNSGAYAAYDGKLSAIGVTNTGNGTVSSPAYNTYNTNGGAIIYN